MKHLILLFLGFLLVFFPNNQTQANEPPEPKEKLKILSWNIYMLPALVRNTGKKERAVIIAAMLAESDYNIIVFQETFHHGARRRMKRILKESYPYEIGPANRNIFSIKTHSGIWIWSKVPIKKLGTTRFKEKHGIDNRMARKGALLVEADLDSMRVQILGTHLNAGGPFEVKKSQYEQIRHDLLEPNYQEGVPQILCGDFNTRQSNEEEYQTMLNTLEVTDGELSGELQCTSDGRNDLNGGPPEKRNVIDYIFLRGNGKVPTFVKRVVKEFKMPWGDKGHKNLSDHHAVEMTLSF